MDAALSPLRQAGVRILNYLDDSLSSLSPRWHIAFLGAVLDSVQMRAWLSPDNTDNGQSHSAIKEYL